MSDEQGISEDSHVNAIVTAQVEGAIVTRWMLVAEVLDEDGDQLLVTRTSDRLAEWDQLGLLGFAAARATARVGELPCREDDKD